VAGGGGWICCGWGGRLWCVDMQPCTARLHPTPTTRHRPPPTAAALFALGAALGVFYHRHRDALGERSDYVLRQLGITLAINLAYSMANKRVDNWCGWLWADCSWLEWVEWSWLGWVEWSWLVVVCLIDLHPTRRVHHGNRGHIGGMVGGAIVAWALGPRLVRDPSTGRVADSPPVPVFANGPGSGLGALMVARSSEGGRKQGGKEAGGGGKKKQQAEERQ
jgi:hypothetical protein